MTIKEKIFNYFASRRDLHVLFVFDPSGLIREGIKDDTTPWPQDYIYKLFEGDWFTTKVKLATEWKASKVVLVFDQMEPNNQKTWLKFPLMSVLQANMVFHEEDAIAFMQQRGIPMQFAGFFKKHIPELLRDRFDKVLSPYYKPEVFNLDYGHRGILSVYVGSSRMLEWYQILAQIIILCALENQNKIATFWGRLTKNTRVIDSDIKNALEEQLSMITGQPCNLQAGNIMQKVVESMRYNAITQQLAVNDADPYKQLKINNSVRLQHLNSMLTSIAENTKIYEAFAPAFAKLGQHIKEEQILEVYGPTAHYTFMSENMRRRIMEMLVKESLYSDPQGVTEKLTVLQDGASTEETFNGSAAFYLAACRYYTTANGIETIRLNTPDNYIQRYTSQFSLLDMYYRQTVSAYAALSVDGKTETLEKTKRRIDNDYASLTNDINIEWVRCIKERGTGFETITSVERQPDFYKNHIGRPKLKTVIIVSDALRYDLARELVERLARKKHVAELSSALAMLPTETKYCKPALLPHKTLACTGTDMEVDGNILSSTSLRTARLTAYNEDAVCVDYDDFMAKDKKEKREVLKNKLVYIFHNTLDDRCHGCNLVGFASACKDTLDELERLIPLIHDFGNVTEVYVTADHGFLYNDKAFEEKDKKPVTEETIEKKTRYFISTNAKEEFGIAKFPLQSVSAMTGDYYVGVPLGTNRLAKEGGDYQFAHGGASLEELVIPVIHSKYKEHNTKAKVSVSLLEPTLRITSSRLKAHLVQGEAVSMGVQELTVVCAVYAGDEVVSALKEITLNSTDEEMGASRIFEVDLTVTKEAASKILQFKVCAKDDMLNPLITKNIINNTLIEQDDF